jgi:hypothetical protein
VQRVQARLLFFFANSKFGPKKKRPDLAQEARQSPRLGEPVGARPQTPSAQGRGRANHGIPATRSSTDIVWGAASRDVVHFFLNRSKPGTPQRFGVSWPRWTHSQDPICRWTPSDGRPRSLPFSFLIFTESIGTNGDTIVCFFGRENSYTLWTLIRSGSALLFFIFCKL